MGCWYSACLGSEEEHIPFRSSGAFSAVLARCVVATCSFFYDLRQLVVNRSLSLSLQTLVQS